MEIRIGRHGLLFSRVVVVSPRSGAFVQVKADLLACPRIDTNGRRRKDELPAKFPAGGRRFAVESIGQWRARSRWCRAKTRQACSRKLGLTAPETSCADPCRPCPGGR